MARTFPTIEKMVTQPNFPATSYSIVEKCLTQLMPFTHSTMSARWTKVDGEWAYEVLPYKTPVAWATEIDVQFETEGYSVTTTKHGNKARKTLTPWGPRIKATA